jgi:hypothetical protein
VHVCGSAVTCVCSHRPAVLRRPQVSAAFIHNVNPDKPKTGDGGQKHVYSRKGLCFFDTYVGAAAKALQLGLLSADDARAVLAQASSDMRRSATVTAFRGHPGEPVSGEVASDGSAAPAAHAMQSVFDADVKTLEGAIALASSRAPHEQE